MKKFFFTLFTIAIMLGVYTGSNLWSNRAFLGQPIEHNIERGEYLSKLSLKYYGTPDYWKELALINRAPEPDLVLPDESIIIPDIEAVKRLHQVRTLSSVNKIVQGLQTTIAQNKQSGSEEQFAGSPAMQDQTNGNGHIKSAEQKPQQLAQVESQPVEETPVNNTESSFALPIILLIVGGGALVALVVFFLIKRRKRNEEEEEVSSEVPSSQNRRQEYMYDEGNNSKKIKAKKREQEEALVE